MMTWQLTVFTVRSNRCKHWFCLRSMISFLLLHWQTSSFLKIITFILIIFRYGWMSSIVTVANAQSSVNNIYNTSYIGDIIHQCIKPTGHMNEPAEASKVFNHTYLNRPVYCSHWCNVDFFWRHCLYGYPYSDYVKNKVETFHNVNVGNIQFTSMFGQYCVGNIQHS